MNAIEVVSKAPVFHRLALALLNFLWQGFFVAGLFAIVRATVSRARARARYNLGCAALAAMVIFPLLTFFSESARHDEGLLASAGASAQSGFSARPGAPLTSGTLPLPLTRITATRIEPWLVLGWMAGVGLLSLDVLLGWTVAESLRRRAFPVTPEVVRRFESLVKRLGVSPAARILQSAAVRVPTALGVFRPVVLLPLSLLSGLPPAEIEAVLAHELAHVRRHDYLVNLLQRAVETLLFYHPAVWWISGCVRSERENCCDDLAVAVSGDARLYARALLHLEEERRGSPALAMAANGGKLWKRVLRLLSAPRGSDAASRAVSGLVALIALAILLAAARVSSPAAASAAQLSQAPAAATASGSLTTADRPAAPIRPAPAAAPVAQAAAPSVISPRPASRVVTAAEPAANPQPREASSRSLTADEIVEFRMHGVTADFVRQIEELGYERASAQTLLSLRVHGVTPEEVREWNTLFGQHLSLERCVGLAIHGVTPDFVTSIGSAFGRVTPEEALSLRIHGVDAEYAGRFRTAGYAPLSVDRALEMRNHGVDPEDATEFARLNLARLSLQELLSARNHGVSPEFAREMQASGLPTADLSELTTLRDHGVTPEYARAIRELGFPKLSVNEALSLRNHGVDPAFVADLRSAGYASLSVDQLIALRSHGVTPEFIRQANAHAGAPARLSVDELIDARIHERS